MSQSSSSQLLTVSPRIRIPHSEFAWTFVRSSGPGGQNVNKVSSKAVLRWPLLASPSLPADVRERFLTSFGSRLTNEGELLITSQRYRDQGATSKTRWKSSAPCSARSPAPPTRRRPTKPTRTSVAKRIESKQARSRTKQMRGRVQDD